MNNIPIRLNDTELQRHIAQAQAMRAQAVARLMTRLLGLPGRLVSRLQGDDVRASSEAVTTA